MQQVYTIPSGRNALSKSGILRVYFDAFSSKNRYGTTFTSDYDQGCFIVFECCSSTGKEKDAETGYGYFGARYMDHELMTMWLSVDPMADKYPSISPYAYCAWNPVKLVDPDGKDTAFASEEARKLYMEYREKVFGDDKFKSIQSELVAIERADDVFCIRTGKDVSSPKDGLIYNNKTNQFDINIGDEVNYGYSFSLLEKLSHELKHVDQYLNKKLGYDRQTHSFIGYSLRDEIEAYQRQGLFGKTIESTDEIRECYKGYGLSCPRVNRLIRLSSAQMEKNNQYVNSGHIPRYLYGGWQNDYKIEQIQ